LINKKLSIEILFEFYFLKKICTNLKKNIIYTAIHIIYKYGNRCHKSSLRG